jgi:hypothetical protein
LEDISETTPEKNIKLALQVAEELGVAAIPDVQVYLTARSSGDCHLGDASWRCFSGTVPFAVVLLLRGKQGKVEGMFHF